MDFTYTNKTPEIMVDAELFGSSDSVINQTLGNQVPGTIIHTAGYESIKQKDFDGSWVEVQ